tara:strand:- start:49 stop:198 length:150 start_codon:yes stop_codon:yes gene_type:complete
MTYRLNGKILPMDRPFEDRDGTKYPKNWLRLSTEEERKRIPDGGIVWTP